nr:MAG TPA: hypothetical protein [Caudoviricetes sp.]
MESVLLKSLINLETFFSQNVFVRSYMVEYQPQWIRPLKVQVTRILIVPTQSLTVITIWNY